MSEPPINDLEFYLVRVEEINKWDKNHEAYGVATTLQRAKEEAFGYLPGNDWTDIISVWRYFDGEWYKPDKSKYSEE
ncbi:hypothetical protein KGY79_13470 [Candidatus Bipolaricaulota bacterium]|nr:hypothetical protein [Candidatus Bipolaricaulota bacterium]